MKRRCHRVGCRSVPVATLTYDYARSTATMAPLSDEHDPGCYDLCLEHARHLQVPSGWWLERVEAPAARHAASDSWVEDLADEVRRIGLSGVPAGPSPDPAGVVELARRGHLRVIADQSA